jgi:glycosyltransferase involved in cell wall biosynthesis
MKQRPIRVLQLGSPAGLYGAERWILALVRHLDPAKVTSVVGVIRDVPGPAIPPLVMEAEALGLETLLIDAPGRINLAGVRELRQYILANKIDILHTHWYKTDMAGFLATRGTDCKIVSTPHGWSRDAGFFLQCYEMMDRMIFPFLDAVVPLSPELYKNLEKIPFLKQKMTLILNGVDITEIQTCTNVHPQLIQWKAQGFFIIGYIGQLIHRKGLDILFNALSILDKNVVWKLALIGDGVWRSFLKKRADELNISENVHFFGFQKHRLDYLNGFDVFVLPSRMEGIPRCLMEAMSKGIPVIASDIPGSRVLVDHEVTGFVYPRENCKELMELIKNILDPDNSIQIVKDNASRLIQKKYSAQRLAADYQKIYCRLIPKNLKRYLQYCRRMEDM